MAVLWPVLPMPTQTCVLWVSRRYPGFIDRCTSGFLPLCFVSGGSHYQLPAQAQLGFLFQHWPHSAGSLSSKTTARPQLPARFTPAHIHLPRSTHLPHPRIPASPHLRTHMPHPHSPAPPAHACPAQRRVPATSLSPLIFQNLF